MDTLRLALLAPHGDEGQADDERRSFALPFALDARRAAVQLRQLTHDGEAEPQSAMSSGGGRVRLTKTVEDVREKVLVDADPCVAHRYLHMRIDARQLHQHPPAFRRELDGVGQEVPDDLLQAV